MAEENTPVPGSIAWRDITVPDAEGLRSFYENVVGWTSEGLDMGGYSDYCVKDAEGNTVAGVCHSRGVNADIPPVWLMYIMVASMDASIQAVRAQGGEVLVEPRASSGGTLAVIRDPAGAISALFESS